MQKTWQWHTGTAFSKFAQAISGNTGTILVLFVLFWMQFLHWILNRAMKIWISSIFFLQVWQIDLLPALCSHHHHHHCWAAEQATTSFLQLQGFSAIAELGNSWVCCCWPSMSFRFPSRHWVNFKNRVCYLPQLAGEECDPRIPASSSSRTNKWCWSTHR